MKTILPKSKTKHVAAAVVCKMAQMTKLCAPRGRHGRCVRDEHVMKTMLPKPIAKHVVAKLVCNSSNDKAQCSQRETWKVPRMITQNQVIAYAACCVLTKTQSRRIYAPRRRPGIPHNSAKVSGGATLGGAKGTRPRNNGA